MNIEQLSLEIDVESIHSNINNKYYKTYSDLPKEYKDYIKRILSYTESYYLLDINNLNEYCPNCYSRLIGHKCINCVIDYSEAKSLFCGVNVITIDYSLKFLIVESNKQNVIAYVIEYDIIYDKKDDYRKTVPSSFKAVLIKENGLLDLNNKIWINYPESKDKITDTYKKERYVFSNLISAEVDYIYPYNLDNLSLNELYKYIDIDKYKVLVNKPYSKSITNLLVNPIVYPEYEYLLKMELYNLICEGIEYLNKGNSFNEIFGFPKKYYNFIKENDIGVSELFALRMYNTDNIDLLEFITCIIIRYDYRTINTIEWIFKTFKNDMNKLCNYINNNNIDLYDYLDYLSWSRDMNIDIKSNKIKYPDDFNKEHDKIYKEMTINKDSNINNKLINIYNSLLSNSYEDDKYVIKPCYDIDSLLNESSEIYFMRYKSNINESLITVEVQDGKVVQARRKYNKDINEEDKGFLKKFEENYLEEQE